MGAIDALLCLGDSIYEYRFSNAVVGRLRELDALTILGNHEEVFLGAAGARARSGAEIDRSLLDWLAERPHRHELRIDGKRILMVHSTPWGAARQLCDAHQRRAATLCRGRRRYRALRPYAPTTRPAHRSGAGDQSRLGR